MKRRNLILSGEVDQSLAEGELNLMVASVRNQDAMCVRIGGAEIAFPIQTASLPFIGRNQLGSGPVAGKSATPQGGAEDDGESAMIRNSGAGGWSTTPDLTLQKESSAFGFPGKSKSSNKKWDK